MQIYSDITQFKYRAIIRFNNWLYSCRQHLLKQLNAAE